ncbi:transcription factor EMB1444 isoform X1 [Morus notabilis]|uniref:transcription factor EMB1444 isoform X1 n=2 Tax=Morus notabilis TaxID=981085 RepID=UPI000CED3453|nr:transcription factor EMB1444 isoform X1 [Morus notabilis]
MESSPLRQFLISLCNNTHWKYAVFWKLQHQTPPILTWEDAYCDNAKPAEDLGSASDDSHVNRSKPISFQSRETSMQDIGSEGCQIELLVANMSCVQYALGDGLVGDVACTGKHTWVFFNNFFTREFDSNLVPDWTDEWLLQIAMGIKTILLVPLLPDGVLQLGSLEMVAEDLSVVGFIKERFDAYHSMMSSTIPFTIMMNPVDHSSLSPLSSTVESLNEPTRLITSRVKSEKLEDFDCNTLNERRLSTSKQSIPVQTVQDMLVVPKNDAVDVFKSTSKNEIGFPEESAIPSLSFDVNSLDMAEAEMFGFSCLEEELLAYSLSSGQDVELFENSLNGVTPCTAGEMAAQLFGDDYINNGYCKSMTSFSRFPEDSELHRALGPSFQERNTYEHFWDSSFLIEDARTNRPSAFCNRELLDVIEPSWFGGSGDKDYLLEAVVTDLCCSSDDVLSSLSDNVPSYVTSSRQSTFSQPQVQSKAGPRMQNCSIQSNLAKPSFLPRVDSLTSLDGMTSTLTNEGRQVKVQGPVQSSKQKRPPNTKTRRTRNGSTQKSRPRDRQLIQDRVKELRELVPNGAKCSIDGLLDQTIKHMLYLESVAGQAKKLKGHLLREAASGRNRRSTATCNTLQNGTSWAFEFGSVQQACPIVVEDLGNTGHMLIEVLCDDHGLFLDIAQLIRRLDLTVLKGVMENRSSNTWAHFVVEATKGFHRMEIFWPLLHLLQRKKNRISSKI